MTEGVPLRILLLHDGDHGERPFLELALETLVRGGAEVVVVDQAKTLMEGAGYLHRGLSGSWRRSLFERRKRKFRHRLRGWRNLGGFLFQTMRVRPDVLIATLPTVGLMGWAAPRLRRPRLVYWPFELFGEQSWEASSFWLRAERFLLRRADVVITQNEERARVYREERGARSDPVVVRNLKRYQPAAPTGELRRRAGLSDGTPLILYEGLLYEGRCLLQLLDAAARLPEESRLVLMGPTTPWWRETGVPRLKGLPHRDRIVVLPPVPHDELPDLVADADAGVILYDDRVRNNVYCAPGKLTDYAHAGVPVIVPPFPALGIVEERGIGVACRELTAQGIAAAVMRVLERPRAEWAAALERTRTELTWETQEPALLGAVFR